MSISPTQKIAMLSTLNTAYELLRHGNQEGASKLLSTYPELQRKFEEAIKAGQEPSKALQQLHVSLLSRPQVRIERLLLENLESTDFSSPYSISIPLLGASLLKSPHYFELKDKMFAALENPDHPHDWQKGKNAKAWLLGRLLSAARNMNDNDTAEKAAGMMKDLLEDADIDSFSAWAVSYLAMCDSSISPEQASEAAYTLALKPQEKGEDNVHWALVMALQSTSDRRLYNALLAKLCSFSERPSVLEALRTIPQKDFRAWAMGLTMLAAARLGDHPLYTTLGREIGQEIETSPSKGDQMLALAFKDLADQIFTKNLSASLDARGR